MVAQLLRYLKDNDALPTNKYKQYCPALINGRKVNVYVDSGNNFQNVVSVKLLKKLNLTERDIQPLPKVTKLGTADKTAGIRVLGKLKKPLTIRFAGTNQELRTRPLVCPELAMEFNLSGAFMVRNKIDQLHSNQSLKIGGKMVPLVASLGKPMETLDHGSAYLQAGVELQPQSWTKVPVRLPTVELGYANPGDVLMEGQLQREDQAVLSAPFAITKTNEDGVAWVAPLNLTEDKVQLKQGQKWGTWKCLPVRKDPLPRESVDPRLPKDKQGQMEWLQEKFQLDKAEWLRGQPEIRHQLSKLLHEYLDIMSIDDDYGETSLVQHEIKLVDGAQPVKQRSRPWNPEMQKKLEEQVVAWSEKGVIEPSTSPWNFGLLPVVKKNGKIRWCVDFRRLNELTVKDSYPVPHIEDNLAKLAKSKVYSALDGAGAYHAVYIQPEDREKTAFSTPSGSYQFRRMAFGLTNAPATYCRLVQKVLEGLPQEMVMAYLDDICVHTEGLEEHLEASRLVFEAHRAAGLKLQPEKCQLFRTTIAYLGHQISEQGVKPLQDHLHVIKDWPLPNDKLGLSWGRLDTTGNLLRILPKLLTH